MSEKLHRITSYNRHTSQVLSNWQYLETNKGNRNVSVDSCAIDTITQQRFRDVLEIPDWKFDGVHPNDNTAFISGVLTHNTINAAYNHPSGTKYSVQFEGKKPLTGAYAMVRCFYRVFGEHPITTDLLDANLPSVKATYDFFQGITDIPHSNRFQMMDVSSIGPIADYEVPRALRGLGIITVSKELEKRIQSWDEIPKDSQEEIELRAATVVGCVQLLDKINLRRQEEGLPKYDMSLLDYWLWSQAKIVGAGINPHRIVTMAY